MQQQRLLIIEDDNQIAALISKVATEVGYTAHIVSGAREIKTVYESFEPEVITLDLVMPEMDGFEVLEYLKSKSSKVHIVLMSGSQAELREMAGRFGDAANLTVSANLAKPFRIPQLRLILQEIAYSLASPDGEMQSGEHAA